MINYIKGEITELTPTIVTLETYGIGYAINISLNTYSKIADKPTTKLFIYESIREDAYSLYGFYDLIERDLFIHLISVSGIGANTGRMILSSMNPQELGSVISAGNTDILKTIKGIGLKTAQRIIVELKDKIKIDGTEHQTTNINLAINALGEESVSALVMLGFAQQPSQKVVAKILKENPSASVENIIKLALKML